MQLCVLKARADAGSSDAANDCGLAYRALGYAEAAFHYFQESARADHVEGLFNFGDCLYHGLGTSIDCDQAITAFDRSSRAGYPLPSQHCVMPLNIILESLILFAPSTGRPLPRHVILILWDAVFFMKVARTIPSVISRAPL
jgi:hypothetical protein